MEYFEELTHTADKGNNNAAIDTTALNTDIISGCLK